jgi:hypothetical protein
VHEFEAGQAYGLGEEVVLATEEVNSQHHIRSIQVLPKGVLLLPKGSGNSPQVSLKDSDWAKPYISGSKSISPQAIYGIFSKSAARQILTGHLLALRFHPLLRMKEIVLKPDMAGLWDKEFKFYNNETGISLTTFTAMNYKMLTEWLETSPSQVLAAIEGVSPSTIRNRLNSAREAGVIGKPGSGKRSSYEAKMGDK